MTTSIQKDALLSEFSVLAYHDKVFLSNPANLPAGWELKAADDQSPPFTAYAFKNQDTGEVVVAYRGTDGLKDGSADLAILQGHWDPQFQQGMDFVASIRSDPRIYDPNKPPEILVTGHSLGGAIAQLVAQAYGLDGSTIDPGAAARIVQTPEFRAAALAAGLPEGGMGAAAAFSNYLVAGSVVSGTTGNHIGQTSYLPSLSFNSEQALTAFLIVLVNPLAGAAYALATDQFTNKHASAQISQALGLLAGSQDPNAGEPGALTLAPKLISFDPETNQSRYSQTEFDVKNAAGVPQGTIKFSGTGDERMMETFDAAGTLKSATTLAATGTITVRPISGPSIVVSYLPQSNLNQDGTVTTISKDAQGNIISSKVTQTFEDGSAIATTSFPNGASQIVTTNPDRTLFQESQTTVDPRGNTDTVVTTGTGQLVRRIHTDFFNDENGQSRIETITTRDTVTRDTYDNDGNLFRSETVAAIDLRAQQTATVFSDVSGFVNSIRSGQPIPLFAGGARLLNDLSVAHGIQNANLSSANNVAAGVLSFYNLYNAFNSGNDFDKLNSSLTAINYANESLTVAGASSAELSTFLNGSPLSAGGSVGVLPVLGLVASIKAKDPIGAAMSLGLMIEGAPFLATPVGWVLIAASILKAVFADKSPPDAWGIAKVTFGEGFTDLSPLVQSSGENFGPDRVRQQLQGVVDVITQIIANNNQSTADSSQWLGLIPQRMPGLTFHAAEFQDKGYAVADIDPLSGAQRIPFVRFDDNGQPFDFVPEQLTEQERAMMALPGSNASPLVAYMLNSALQRGAIAPMWEVQTAKMQEQSGDPNAGLTEEERGAKAGLAAPIDSQYAASHTADPQAANRRQGHFMAVGLDLSGDGRIDTRTIAQIEAGGQTITFDWDSQGYQKETGWIGAGDAFLVLDHDFNQSADDAKELLSNPLIADPGKGLRVLAAYDANGDGRIDANDPVYQQLKVWQDLDQDGNNIHTINVNAVSAMAQDETGGVKELRSLEEAGITAIDYANGRFEMGPGNYRLIETETLEAQGEGTKYTPVGAGIQIKVSNGAPQILVTQVQSEQAVYDDLQIAASGETIGVPGAELYEDGVPTAYDPSTQGGPIELVINTAQLLQNDTWGGEVGAQAGVAVSGVRAGAHTSVGIRPDGNISLRLEANYSGPAEFFYTVAVPGFESLILPREARVGLNITPVNDAPTASNSYDPDRSVYGYAPQGWSYTTAIGDAEAAVFTTTTGAVPGLPVYEPYVEHVPEQPIFEMQLIDSGENSFFQQVQVGTTPAHDVVHDSVIATDRTDTGHVLASDPDGGSFSYQVITQATFGTASVDANGSWSYLGRRPRNYHIEDVTGDGQKEWLNPSSGTFETSYTGDPNIDSNGYIGDETDSFADFFTVRVFDNSDPSGQTFRDVQLQATHYGPAPLPVVAGSGGGKKPIAIDLDGDGFHFQDVDDSNVFFEVNGEGWKRRIAWTEPDDGLLAFDKNGDGRIDRSDEISFVPYAPGQQTDMAALRQAFDTNGDGRFDATDSQWSSFGVWRDANSNGVTDPGEFRSLGDTGITSIDLTTDGQFSVVDGQTVHGIGSATLADGSSLAVADVTLRYTNETQVVTSNPDGSASTSVVLQSSGTPGQDFEGTADKDLVFGTKGSDRFRMGDGDDVVVDDAGNDVVDAGGGNDQVFTGIDNDVVYGGAGNDSIYTGAGNDLVFGDGAGETGDDMIMLEDGNDVAFGGDGDDFISGGLGNDVLSGNMGNDKLFGEAGWDALFGQEGDDELYGMDGNDMLDGDDGNDLLAGGTGDDSMDGGAGDDTYEVDSTGDTVTEAVAGGNDTVESSIAYTLGENLENLRLVGDAATAGTGNAADNLLVGNDQANTLVGLAGNDTLDGGPGADALIGGSGDDTYVIDNAGDVVIEAAGEGNDTVRSRVTTSLTANVENLTLAGINAIDGTGNELANVLVGNIAANVLDGGNGADTMRGGRGDDTYLVDNAADVVVEQPGEGRDTVVASVSFALTENVENLTLTGSAMTGIGNGLANLMIGNTEANVLDGGAGADQMWGRGGDDIYIVDDVGDAVTENVGEGDDTVIASVSYTLSDNVENLRLVGFADLAGSGNVLSNVLEGNAGANLLDGGSAADRMFGGAGDDTYVVDNAGDLAVEAAADGNDAVLASVSYALNENVENLTLTGSADLAGYGNELDNVLTGNAGANLLDGAGGGDLMAGGAGDDRYMVDDARDQVVEWFDSGNDTVLAGIDYVLPQYVENLLLTGAALSGTGNELANMISGNSLDNLIDGGGGDDSMIGGGGNDTYIVDNTGDTLHENAGEGTDHVIASVSYTLSENVEDLALIGNADLSATGNELDNVIEGNDGSNLIDGGAGADTMSGGAGDDRYMVDDAADTVLEAQNAGVDTIVSNLSYTLSDNVENLVLTGGATWGAGNDLDNQLTGNAMDNLLDGAGGADRMAGGQGNDVYIVDDLGDAVVEAAGEGTDTIRASVSYTLSDNLENLVLTGTDNIIGTGNALDNTIVGNSGNNALDGGLGNDLYMYQLGGGLDRITDAGGMDTVQFGAGLTLDSVALRIAFVGDQKIAQVRLLDATGNEMPDQGFDYVMDSDSQNRLSSPIESFVFADGSRYEWSDLLIQSTTLTGTRGDDLLIAGRNDDTLYGDRGNDAMYGGSGNDTLYGQDGNDILHGFGGNDRLYGGNDDDELYGDAGDDQLFGESGDNYLLDRSGNNLFYGGNHKDVIQAGAGVDRIDSGNDADLVDAGAANDVVLAGNGDDWIAAGQGNDTVYSGNGHNLLAFNRGDGVDTVSSNGRDVLSLGGGILYADLRLTKTGNDLILATGQGESVNLKDWYRGSKSKPVDTLQVITVGGDYDSDSADETRNRQVEVFDFTRVVQSFDAARATNASDASNWSVMNSLLDAHLQGSDTAALGGDLSFQYGVSGSLAGIGLTAAQSMLGEGSTTMQRLKPRSELEAATVKLS